VAFANGAGGTVIIGVNGKTREIIGIDDSIRNKIYDEFPNSLYDSSSPSIFANIYEKNFGDKSVIIIEIPPSNKKPCFIKSKGIPKGVFVRVGSSTRRANEHVLEELYRDSKRISYDEELVEADLSILASKNIKAFYKKNIDEERLQRDKFISQTAPGRTTYKPTVAGTLIFCEDPSEYVTEAVILCSRFRGSEGRNIIQTERITGTLEEQVNISFELVKSWLQRDYKLEGIRLKAKTIIPEAALREAIINAVVHRKYSILGAIKITLYYDHLEIFSPGCFPGLININNLGDGSTFFRNPNIAKAFRKLGLIETLGSGVRLIFDSCKKAKLAMPKYHEEGDFVKLCFSFDKERDENLQDEEAILEFLNDKEEANINELAQYLRISRNTVSKKVGNLIKLGKVIRLGHTRSTRLKISQKSQRI
jgi:predicted HTH transcriptional regulator